MSIKNKFSSFIKLGLLNPIHEDTSDEEKKQFIHTTFLNKGRAKHDIEGNLIKGQKVTPAEQGAIEREHEDTKQHVANLKDAHKRIKRGEELDDAHENALERDKREKENPTLNNLPSASTIIGARNKVVNKETKDTTPHYRSIEGHVRDLGKGSRNRPEFLGKKGTEEGKKAEEEHLIQPHGRTNKEVKNNISQQEAEQNAFNHPENANRIKGSRMTGIVNHAGKPVVPEEKPAVVSKKKPVVVKPAVVKPAVVKPPKNSDVPAENKVFIPKSKGGRTVKRLFKNGIGTDSSSIIGNAREKAAQLGKARMNNATTATTDSAIEKPASPAFALDSSNPPTATKPKGRKKALRKLSQPANKGSEQLSLGLDGETPPATPAPPATPTQNQSASHVSQKSREYAKKLLAQVGRTKKRERDPSILNRSGSSSLQKMKDYRAELEKNKSLVPEEKPGFTLSPSRQTSTQHGAEQTSHVEALKKLVASVKAKKVNITPEDTAKAMANPDFGPSHPDYAVHAKNYREHTAEVHSAREKLSGNAETSKPKDEEETKNTNTSTQKPEDETKNTNTNQETSKPKDEEETKKTSKLKKFSDFVKVVGKGLKNKAQKDIQRTRDYTKRDMPKLKKAGETAGRLALTVGQGLQNKALKDMQRTRDLYDNPKTKRDVEVIKKVGMASGRIIGAIGKAAGRLALKAGKGIINRTHADDLMHNPNVDPTPHQTALWLHNGGYGRKNYKNVPLHHLKNLQDDDKLAEIKRHFKKLQMKMKVNEAIQSLYETKSKKDVNPYINLSGKKVIDTGHTIPETPEYSKPSHETEEERKASRPTHTVSGVISHPDEDNGIKKTHTIKIKTHETDPKKIEKMARSYHEGRGYKVHSVKHEGSVDNEHGSVEIDPKTGERLYYSPVGTPIGQKETKARNEREAREKIKQEEKPTNYGGHIIHSGGVSEPYYVHAENSEDAKVGLKSIGEKLGLKGIKGVVVHDQKTERPYTVHTGHYDDSGKLVKMKHILHSEYSSNPKIQKGTEKNVASIAEIIHAHKHEVQPHHEFTQTVVIPHKTK